MNKITVSFKDREKYLYDYLNKVSSSPGTYLKDLAIKDYNKSQTDDNKSSNNPSDIPNPVIDFLD